MKSAAIERKKLKIEKQNLAVIAGQVRGQSQLDRMLMKYEDGPRRIIFRAMRPFLSFDAIYPTVENTAPVTSESFAALREANADVLQPVTIGHFGGGTHHSGKARKSE